MAGETRLATHGTARRCLQPSFYRTKNQPAMTEPVTIIGGGLSGLTLGIGLRQRDVPVTIHESGDYPRHRVCGEFISGRGQLVLDRLGLLADFKSAGAIYARTAMF